MIVDLAAAAADSAEFQSWLIAYLEALPPLYPISQVTGFTQYTAVTAPFIFTDESTTSSTYGNLATTGPTLSGLADGKYVIHFGAASYIAAGGTEAGMSIQVNSAAVSDNDACISQVGSFVSISTTVAKSLSNNGSNSITAKYRSLNNVNAAHFARRWLIAQRYSNL